MTPLVRTTSTSYPLTKYPWRKSSLLSGYNSTARWKEVAWLRIWRAQTKRRSQGKYTNCRDPNRSAGASLTRVCCSADDATPRNPRGIPHAPFVDKVEDYIATRQDVEPTLRSFQEMIS